MNKLFASADDFRACCDRGLAVIMAEENAIPPDPQHLEDMRALYALFITSVLDADATAHLKPDWEVKISAVRMQLLAAYNLGKQAAKAN